jgi:hypothetical protein
MAILNNRKLPVGIQDFEKLRKEEYVYVDKTEYVYQLTRVSSPYFLGRPRRFGKSLFLSTLKAYFQGKKELFEGLAIRELEKDWIEYPIFHIDMNVGIITDESSLKRRLDVVLSGFESKWGRTTKDTDVATRFEAIIRQAYEQTGCKVVVLVDEYDKPLLNTIESTVVNENIRDILKGFYGVLKSADANLRFVFLTGVTKFSKVSVFSDLNHLLDISLNEDFAGICGISETELTQYFQPEIKTLAEKDKLSYEETLARLKKHYDGYHFAKQSKDMYNPFSVLNAFFNKDIGNYWFETGTPTFLIQILKNINYNIPNLENDTVIPARSITDYKAEYYNNPIPLLYQSGYLTIKSYNREYDEYILGFPNDEVKYGFLDNLLPAYAPQYAIQQEFSAASFVKTLRAGDIDAFMNNMRSFYASISYEQMENKNKDEQYYQFIFYLLVKLMGQFVQTEVKTATGRVDAVIITSDTVFVFEFKMAHNGTAEDAIKQINEKGYLIPYQSGSKKIVKVGAEFSEKERGLSRWIKG